jgi:hypothetical protein
MQLYIRLLFCNYKHDFNIVLLALVGVNYHFVTAGVIAHVKNSGGHIFQAIENGYKL